MNSFVFKRIVMQELYSRCMKFISTVNSIENVYIIITSKIITARIENSIALEWHPSIIADASK